MNQNISMQILWNFYRLGNKKDTSQPMKIDTFTQEILTVILPKKILKLGLAPYIGELWRLILG